MKLHVIERIKLLNILPIPENGNYLTYKLMSKLIGDLSFSEKEYKLFGIKEENGQVTWKTSKEKEVQISDIPKAIIIEKLKQLDKENRMDIFYFNLADRFIPEGLDKIVNTKEE